MNSVMESLWYGNISPHDTIVEENRYPHFLLSFVSPRLPLAVGKLLFEKVCNGY